MSLTLTTSSGIVETIDPSRLETTSTDARNEIIKYWADKVHSSLIWDHAAPATFFVMVLLELGVPMDTASQVTLPMRSDRRWQFDRMIIDHLGGFGMALAHRKFTAAALWTSALRGSKEDFIDILHSQGCRETLFSHYRGLVEHLRGLMRANVLATVWTTAELAKAGALTSLEEAQGTREGELFARTSWRIRDIRADALNAVLREARGAPAARFHPWLGHLASLAETTAMRRAPLAVPLI